LPGLLQSMNWERLWNAFTGSSFLLY